MADPKAIQFLEGLYARVDKQVRDIVSSMLPGITIAAQDDGQVIANDHRILNFQGPGVSVSDESAMRRVNVFIPGAPTASSTNVLTSAVGSGKFYSVGVGGTPPANWYQPSYNDSAWTAPVAPSTNYPTGGWGTPTTAAWVAYSTAATFPASNEQLHRRTFTLPSGSVADVQLELNVDNYSIEVYVNGTSVPAATINDGSSAVRSSTRTITIPASLLLPGASNLLAFRLKNSA